MVTLGVAIIQPKTESIFSKAIHLPPLHYSESVSVLFFFFSARQLSACLSVQLNMIATITSFLGFFTALSLFPTVHCPFFLVLYLIG